ncbi:MAG TPA: hypothetical protein PK530_15265 [Anaerolineales bacterium]|nr:hypothetical protein [Anaerolineales bacterium]
MTNKILFNGKEYNSPNEMPPEARRAYETAIGQVNNLLEDKDRDGVPDIFENLTPGNSQNVQVFTTSQVIVDGEAYDSLSEMPPEVQQKFQAAFEDKNRDGIPDAFEKLGQARPSSFSGTYPQPTPPPSVMKPESVSPLPWLILAGTVIIVLLVIIAGLAYLLLT